MKPPRKEIERHHIEQIIEMVSCGVTSERGLAMMLGIPEARFRDWAALGRERYDLGVEGHVEFLKAPNGRPTFTPEAIHGDPYVAMVVASTEVRARRLMKLHGCIVSAARDDWKAAAWLLERTEGEFFGREVRVEANVAVTSSEALEGASADQTAALLRAQGIDPDTLQPIAAKTADNGGTGGGTSADVLLLEALEGE